MPEKTSQDRVTAALLIIGNEILSGRTQDQNIQFIAGEMVSHGIDLAEVRVVPDIQDRIVEAVNDLRRAYTYVFTTGGIGPTHDDITSESIAAAFSVELEQNETAYKLLLEHYGPDELTPVRLKMAIIPKGASLIPNPVSTAPGFVIENVHVMAGVPVIMQAMLANIVGTLEGGRLMHSNSMGCSFPESTLAEKLSELQDKYEGVDIGSYPQFRAGKVGVSVVLRSVDEEVLKKATEELIKIIRDLGEEPQAMSFQVAPDCL